MSWVNNLFRRNRTKVISLNTWLNENPIYSETSFESLVTHGWRKNELIFSCISKTANTASQVSLKFYRNDNELESHPVKQLIQAPNPYMSEFDLWAAVIIYQKLAGAAYFEKERSRAGQVVALWPLRPDWITPIANSQGRRPGITRYEYKVPGLPPESLDAEDVVVFPLFDPLGMFNRWPPVAVAARTGDVDNATTDYLKLFMQKGGTPPGILTSTQRLIDAQVEDIRRRWRQRYGGYENWMDPAVLDSDAKYQQTGSSFKDMGFEVLDARNEARICMVIDIPPILVGAKIGLDRSTFSNYGEARQAWWEDSLLPMYKNFTDVIINQILVEFETGITAAWDYSQVNALQEDRNKRWTRATAALQAGAITVNEFCKEVGIPDKGPAGEYYLRSGATVEVPAKTGIRPMVETIVNPTAPTTDDESEPGGKSAKAANPPDERTRRKHEKIIETAMVEFFDDELARVKKEVRNNGH